MNTIQPLIIFLHIPKTAGTTLGHILNRHYQYRDMYFISPTVNPGDGSQTLKQIRQDEFSQLPPSVKSQTKLLQGHIAYGLHSYFTSRPPVYFTILRNPIELAISFYYYVRRSPEHKLYALANQPSMTIEKYLQQHISYTMNNIQTRFISGVWTDIPHGECTRDHLEQAKQNLRDNIEVIGLTEHFDETLLLLKHRFGWSNLHYKRKNVTRQRPTKKTISATDLQAIKKANALDLELYEYASQLFDKQVKAIGPSFPQQLRALKFNNRYIAPLTAHYWRLRQYPVRTYIKQWLSQSK